MAIFKQPVNDKKPFDKEKLIQDVINQVIEHHSNCYIIYPASKGWLLYPKALEAEGVVDDRWDFIIIRSQQYTIKETRGAFGYEGFHKRRFPEMLGIRMEEGQDMTVWLKTDALLPDQHLSGYAITEKPRTVLRMLETD